MQRNLLTEFNLTKLEFKNLQNVGATRHDEPGHTLQDNNKKVKNYRIKSLHYKSDTPSMLSELAEINFSLPISIRNIDTVSKGFILTNPLTKVEESIENGGKILDKNSSRLQLPKKSCSKWNIPSAMGGSAAHLVPSTGNSNNANNAAVNRSSRAHGFNDTIETKPPCGAVIVEPGGKSQAQHKLDTDFNRCPGKDSLPLIPSAELSECHSGNSSNNEECEVVTERINDDHDFSPENEPYCVISEIIGNADVVFSNICDSDEDCKKSPDVENKRTDSTASKASRDDLEVCEIIDEKIDSAFSDSKLTEKNQIVVLETEAKVKESKDAEINNLASNNANARESSKVTSEGNPVEKCCSALSGSEGVKETPAEISETEKVTPKKSQPESTISGPEVQLITPKKTNDITKIKGWRRKQFLVEKPTTVEFYRLEKGSRQKKIKIKSSSEFVVAENEEAGNVKNAFVCDSLDEFLDREVELKIGYEIPHLYAEVGIKLTKEDIASKPNLSDKDFKEVESRYCVPVQGKNDVVDLDEIDEGIYKSGKRRIDDDTKPFKFLKLHDGKRQSGLQKHEVRVKDEKKENAVFEGTKEQLRENGTPLKYAGGISRFPKSFSSVKLESKLLGLVVYPGPFRPLHPIVQHHLAKLRSYSTRIDKNWADFAASAVLANDKHYKRRILPVRCCVKTEKCAEAEIKDDSEVKKRLTAGAGDAKSAKRGEENVKLKCCSVVIDKIDLEETLSPWCMEHHTYNCEPCGLLKTKSQSYKSLLPCTEEMSGEKTTASEGGKSVVSPKATFDRRIANLLARKLRTLKFKGENLTSIDSLKKLVPDSVEFIKLNFVKESFLSAYISIWFLKQENPWTRSRAFLTFSQTPPVPNAVNLRSHALSVKNLPKVITEIMSSDNVFSPNEYAILHCNGEIWEIHGSLNIAIGKSDTNVEQIFASLHIPELNQLQRVAEKILNANAVKWWVMDLTQKFKLVEIKFGNVISVVSRNKFLETLRYDSQGFMPIRKNSEGRILGAYIFRPLLPFVLMGPYYLLETHNMTLKGERSTLPFMYFIKENVTKDTPLKYFINSVLKDVQENDKILEGLWLYDKMRLDSTAYLEVITRALSNPVSSKFGSIQIEHGYSLSSLTNSLPSGVTDGVLKRKDGQEELKKVTVFLYFDVFELGYVEGELQRDNSVIICHPLDRRTKVKSHRVGDWFVRTIRRRIEFIPKDMEVKWFITKHKEDLRERRPFNKFLLGGAHVLTKCGIFYLLEMSESRIAKLGLEKSEIVKAIKESQVIRVVLEMRKLANLLSGSPDEGLSMEKVLTKAIGEIERVRLFGECLEKEKMKAEEEKLSLLRRFLQTLKSCQANDQFKLKMIENVEGMFVKNDGVLSEEFVTKLKEIRIGRKYLFKKNRRCYRLVENIGDANSSDVHSKTTQSAHKKCKRPKFLLNSFKRLNFSTEKSPVREGNSPRVAEASEDLSKLSSSLPQQKTSDPTPVEISDIRNVSPDKTKPTQDCQGRETEGKEVQCNEVVAGNVKNSIVMKSDGFLKPTSTRLPENIKFYWKNRKS